VLLGYGGWMWWKWWIVGIDGGGGVVSWVLVGGFLVAVGCGCAAVWVMWVGG